jgi:thioesterase domain-containing protein
MSPLDLERYLHEQIPLSAAMQVVVLAATPEQVRLAAPLAPNINHRRTVFGGSAAAVATLAAWGLLHLRLSAHGFAGRLVIRRSEMDFEQAIAGDFEAEARAPANERWERFRSAVARGRPARIEMRAALIFAGAQTGAFTGEFVALPAADTGAP